MLLRARPVRRLHLGCLLNKNASPECIGIDTDTFSDKQASSRGHAENVGLSGLPGPTIVLIGRRMALSGRGQILVTARVVRDELKKALTSASDGSRRLERQEVAGSANHGESRVGQQAREERPKRGFPLHLVTVTDEDGDRDGQAFQSRSQVGHHAMLRPMALGPRLAAKGVGDDLLPSTLVER